MNPELILRSRLAWLVSQPPIEDAALFLRDGSVIDAGPWSEISARHTDVPVEDLGEVALIPGLVNAHCHLDYTAMAGMIAPPSNFPDWIKAILQIKAHWSYTEYAASWIEGARQLLESGVTAVGDIEAVPELLPESWEATPLRMISFFEMTGVRSQGQPERILAHALADVRRVGSTSTKRAGLSPHALYSTPPDLLRLTAELIQREPLPVTTHLAESIDEMSMYRDASGALFNWLKTQRAMDDCGQGSPVQQARRLGLLEPGFIAVHCNHLAPGDAELLARNQCHVVHCPRSHEYFHHAPFPFEELARAGVNICFGTDSLASVRLNKGKLPTLNLWDEMQLFAANFPNVAPSRIFEMATVHGARALNLPANRADLIAVEYSGAAETLPDFLVHNPPIVRGKWIAGVPVAN